MTKAIIDKRIYDTETAKEIASWDNGLSYSDFNNIYETLYRTQKGQYFLQGKVVPIPPIQNQMEI